MPAATRYPKPRDDVPPTAIESDVLYPLAEFRARTGLGEYAMRTARKSGLKVRYVGNRGFVLGADFICFLTQHQT
ncbi:hypothetical protein [Alienimonas californiensis]|uniref:Uncharacterized protein n=1 Tax=Alienimonas californiensis TaxID=2527989 RepID=A0A517P5G0_9PLAN|nr:hypothetical protein [Alienimonas californiensis]QDT14607.1 hypothetical protein CA12_06830 [Alienimonas californiensis]